MEKQLETGSLGDGILVVENELILAEDLVITLRDFGYHLLDRASTGPEAIEKVRHGHFGFVLMDIKLDGQMDGIEAAGKIKTISDIPIVYLTAFSNEAYLQRAKETMPYGYLLKPFRDKELKAVIEMAFHKAEIERRQKNRIKALEAIVQQARTTGGIVVICSHCKKIRNADGSWEFIESYLESHALGRCSHSICPMCADLLYPDYDPYE